jgi:hypothetical protein
MASDDMAAYMERARQQTDMFLARSREQMHSSLNEQRAQFAGIPYGGGFQPPLSGSGGGYPQSGTPAARLMDTLNEMARKGLSAAGGMVATPISAAAGAAVSAGSFLYGSAPFGPSGIMGGARTEAQRNMGFGQSLFTAFGSSLGTFGKWAGQRLDMTTTQAVELARDELSYKVLKGGQRALWGAADVASMGVASYVTRRAGLGLENMSSHEFARNLQNQLRFVGGDALRAAGAEVGALGTGTTRSGARGLAGELARNLGGLEAEMGLSANEIMGLQNRAMGTMGITGIEKALKGGNFAGEVGKQTRATRDIQQTLNLSEKEAKEFFDTIGQMYGTADKVAKMAKDAARLSGQLSMDKRAVFGMMREYEDMGRTMAMGQENARKMGMGYVTEMRGQQRLGVMNREEIMRYGGTTEEEGMAIRAKVQVQQNLEMFAGGRMRGFDVMAMARPGTYSQFMGGGMGAMEAAGAIGGTLARDPTAGMRARYDQSLRAKMGREGARLQYQRVQAERESGMFIFNNEEQMISRYESLTGLDPETAAQNYRIFEREKSVFGSELEKLKLPVTEGKHVQKMYSDLMSRGMLDYAMAATGAATPYEGAAKLYARIRDKDKGGPKAGQSLESYLRSSGGRGMDSAEAGRKMGIKGQMFGMMMGGADRSIVGLTKHRQATGASVQERIADIKMMRGAITSAFIKEELVTPILAMGGEATRDVLGGSIRFETKGGKMWIGELTSEGEMKVNYGGIVEDVRIQDIQKKYGDEIGDKFSSALGKVFATVGERTEVSVRANKLRNEGEALYKEMQFNKVRGVSESVFGETIGLNLENMEKFSGFLANAEHMGPAVLRKLGAPGLEGFERFSAAFSGDSGKFKVTSVEALKGMFGSEEETAAKIAEAFAATGGPDMDAAAVLERLKSGDTGLLAAVSRQEVVTDLVGQLGSLQERERTANRGASDGNPVFIEMSEKSVKAIAEAINKK